jgi:hypothetical protein
MCPISPVFVALLTYIYKTGINHQNSRQLQLQLNKSPINLKISLKCYLKNPPPKLDTSNLLFFCTPDILYTLTNNA